MTIPRVSEAHKEHRRQAILNAAMEVFIGKGYQVATINDIAQQAHLSVGAIYRYFPTKGELMLALVNERLGRAPELFARLTERAGGPWERLERSVDLFTTALRVRHPGTGRLLLVTLAEAVQSGEVRHGLHERFAGLVDYLAGVIQDGVNQGLFRADTDPRTLAFLLLSAADGLAVYWVTGAPGIDLKAMRLSLLSMLRAYLIVKE
ncbi:MAG: TetR/AcrR family transcriptional regulator [Bacillota bacterium]